MLFPAIVLILPDMWRYPFFCTTFLLCFLSAPLPAQDETNYRDKMRQLVIDISSRAKKSVPAFLVVTQNGNALFENPADTPIRKAYLDSIDGVGQESLRFGDPSFGTRTASETTGYLLPILKYLESRGKSVLTIDYCKNPLQISEIFSENRSAGFIPFVASSRNLDTLPVYSPALMAFSARSIETLEAVKNFLFLINPDNCSSKDTFISALSETNYDLLVIDAYFDGTPLAREDIQRLEYKKNGAKRLVLAYMSIGEAEDYRDYWRTEWNTRPPEWIESENPEWKGNFRVRYWESDWRALLFGTPASYLERIIDAGFSGVYLDTVDTFYFFETRSPQETPTEDRSR